MSKQTHRDRIENSRNMTPEQIRRAKCERSKQRNAERKRKKRDRAEKRNNAWAKLSPKQQLASLDNMLGKGVGAKKQRARIQTSIKEKSSAKTKK